MVSTKLLGATGLAVLAFFTSRSQAVVAIKDLPLADAPPAVCYIEMWNTFQADILSQPSSACTGTLIRNNRVLTAAHCIPGVAAAQSTRVTCNNGKVMFGVQGYKADPEHTADADESNIPDMDLHDVAILDLSSPQKPGNKNYITPMVLATDEEITGALQNPDQCQLWGYGRTDDSQTDNSWGELHGANIDDVTPEAWLAMGESPQMDREIYTGPTHAGSGDSGGPIVCPSSNGGVIQIATTMDEGHLQAGPNSGFYYSAHEKISYNLDWINQTADLPELSRH